MQVERLGQPLPRLRYRSERRRVSRPAIGCFSFPGLLKLDNRPDQRIEVANPKLDVGVVMFRRIARRRSDDPFEIRAEPGGIARGPLSSDPCGHGGFYRAIEPVTAVVIADMAAIEFVAAATCAGEWLPRSGGVHVRLLDYGRADLVSIAAPDAGTQRHWIGHAHKNRPDDINRLSRREDRRINRAVAEPLLQFPIGERPVGPEEQPDPDPIFDTLAAGERPPARCAVEFLGEQADNMLDRAIGLVHGVEPIGACDRIEVERYPAPRGTFNRRRLDSAVL
jgi:hypothetical protein